MVPFTEIRNSGRRLDNEGLELGFKTHGFMKYPGEDIEKVIV